MNCVEKLGVIHYLSLSSPVILYVYIYMAKETKTHKKETKKPKKTAKK